MAEEKSFENKIKSFLEEQGAWYVKYFANRMTKVGIPDILACVNGYFVAIEVKASKGKPSDLQLYHREKIRKSGGISIILYPNQFEEFKELIEFINLLEPFTSLKIAQYQFDKERRKQ